MRQQHGVDILADDHAGARGVGELLVERVAETGEELDRLVEVLHGQVDENLHGHLVLPEKISDVKRAIGILRTRAGLRPSPSWRCVQLPSAL